MASLLLLGLGLVIATQGFHTQKAYYKITFAAGCICCFIWLFSFSILYSVHSKSTALFLSKIGVSGAIFTAMTFHHFIVLLLNRHERYFILATYIIGIIFTGLLWLSGCLITGIYTYTWGYYPRFSNLNLLSIFVFIALFFRGALLSYFGYHNKLKEGYALNANRIKYIFWGFVIGPIAAVDYLPAYGVSFYPFGFLIMSFWICIISYAILRHRLMDIEVIIRETAVFAGIFGFSVGIFMLVIVAGEQFIQPYIGQSQWFVPALSLLLVTFAIRPIERLAYNVIGKRLFRKKFEYQKILRDASIGMSTVRDPKKLLGLIVHIISMKIRLSNVSILIYDEKQSIYKIKASRNNSRILDINMTLSTENPLIQWLVEKKKPLTLEETQRWNRDDTSYSLKSVLTSDLIQIEHRMKDLGAAVCVPSFYRDELLGILVLGNKKSGDFFSQDDLDLFSALSDESAVALKNSQLYFEIDKKANELEELYKREHRLFMHASVAFAAAIDARDPYTHGHSERVTNFSLAILDCMGAVYEVDNNPLFRQRLQIAAVLHDIGKIGVPDNILHKPSKLSDKEWEAMRKHPVTGAEIVTHIKGLRDLIGGIRHHHERYDGKGYPDGLKSDEIPFMAKIIAVADTFDAMTSDRPYRKGLPVEVAREEIQRNAAAQFDPYMVAAFLKAYEQGAIKQSAVDKKVELIID